MNRPRPRLRLSLHLRHTPSRSTGTTQRPVRCGQALRPRPLGARAWLVAGAVGLIGLNGCATPAGQAAPGAPAPQALACALPTNCVSSSATSDLPPLRYTGGPENARALLRQVLGTYPEVDSLKVGDLTVDTVFTTPTLGFRDQVEFQIDPAQQLIHFRSRSLAGLYDFGKNRARMVEFSARWRQMAVR